MLAGPWPQAHFVNHRPALVLAGVPLPLRLLVLELAVVQDAADGRLAVGVDLYEIKIGFTGPGHCFSERDDPVILAAFPDDAYLACAYALVDTKLAGDGLVPLRDALRHC